ncbi:SMP-30/gluconolactonase/LRE family protein [Dyadobacter sp. LHD-138]|uniref:SMP-30/gluconolactonase/LRE family protein n=1 Tax=Dyadobacter sp. LHD-138 TaxID=3071413 RepID=UPI0027E1E81A|nr:SMP-30/gluconolactonase/LRE family protein [Dyadobacter sp. LHD-138]MDQ6478266.1 SMP-30/gluconolactonase/LRE family protein [Dyadobacter sp. LHD-138]
MKTSAFALFVALLISNNFSSFGQSKKFSAEGEFTANCEGPAVDSEGNIYAVNFARDGTIAQMNRRGKSGFFVTLPKGSTGNGIRFADKNTFYVADFTGHNVLKVDMITKNVTVFANEPRMNQPNDLAITKSGHIFCSDPNWKEGTGQIWHVSPAGKTRLVAEKMGTTNGIDISPDEKTLYVNESVQRNVWAFDLASDGTLSNKRLIHTFADGGMDGMRCDIHGNLYIARHGKGEVAVLSPAGKVIHTIPTIGKKVSNICFGGKNGKTCYITLQDRGCLETFKAKTAGREWQMMKEFSAGK